MCEWHSYELCWQRKQQIQEVTSVNEFYYWKLSISVVDLLEATRRQLGVVGLVLFITDKDLSSKNAHYALVT